MKQRIKNALSFLKPKEKPEPDFYNLSFEHILGGYFTLIVNNSGKGSQELYDELLKLRAELSFETLSTTKGLTNALKIIENYRNWDARELGWK